MIIERKNTRKGLVVRFIFEDEEEYEMYMKDFSVFSQEMGEGNNKEMEELIILFQDYYKSTDEYYEGKPTVTVFEDHILTLAALIWSLAYMYFSMTKQINKELKETNKLLKENIELKKLLIEINYDNT